MLDAKTAPYGALVLRLALGTMYVVHSVYLKLFVFTLAGTAQYFVSLGQPEAFAYLVFAAEAIGGAMLILGIAACWVAVALIPILIGTIVLVHGANGWLFSSPGGGWEYPAFLAVASLALALLGDGAMALKPIPAPARDRA